VKQSVRIYDDGVINKIRRTPNRSSQFFVFKICKRIFTNFYIQGRRAFEMQFIEVL